MRSHLILVAWAACVLFLFARAEATDLKTKVSGTSTGSGKISRTITDISEPPPGPARLGPARAQVLPPLSVTIPAGATAVAVATALIDSIIAQLGPFGFSASFASPPDSTLVLMSHASRFCSDESNTVRGIGVDSGDMLVFAEHKGHFCGSPGALAPSAASQPPSAPPSAARAIPLRGQRGAGIPEPANSSMDSLPTLRVCPAGDILFHATIRDVYNTPVPNATVILDFSLCSGFPVCVGPSSYSVDAAKKNIWKMTDALGDVEFAIGMGGCPTGAVLIYTDSGLLGTKALASPDQNGDLMVDVLDLTTLAAKVGTSDLTGDFDGDSAVCGSSVNGIGDVRTRTLPGLALQGLSPNILHPGEPTTIEFRLSRRADLVVELFDVVGRRIWRQPMGAADPGPRRLEWRVPEGTRPGLYSLRLRTSAGERGAQSLVIR